MRKTLSALLAGLMLTTMIAGCSGAATSNSDTAEDKSLQEIKDKGKIVLGLDDSFPPMGFRNSDNEIIGFDIDVAKEVASRLEVELVIQPIKWANNIQEINSKSIDLIWNGMSINDTRKEKLTLSDPYLRNRMILVVLDDSDIKSIADLKDKKIGVQNGSTAQEILAASEVGKAASDIVGYEDNLGGFLDLEAKGTSAFFIDEVFADYYIATNKKPYRVLDDGALEEEEYAIGFRKNDKALRDEIQNILSAMKKDGKLGEISTKWFGSDITVVK